MIASINVERLQTNRYIELLERGDWTLLALTLTRDPSAAAAVEERLRYVRMRSSTASWRRCARRSSRTMRLRRGKSVTKVRRC